MAWGQQQTAADAIIQSQYNAAFQKIERLNQSWQVCRAHWRAGNLSDLKFELEAIFIELEADTTKKQRQTVRKINNRIQEIHNLRAQQSDKSKISFLNNKLAKQIKILWSYMFRLEKAQGLGKKYKDKDEDIF